MGLWDSPVSNEPAIPPEIEDGLEQLKDEDGEFDAERIRKILERSAKGAAELDRNLRKVFTYQCCPGGCCMCRRY